CFRFPHTTPPDPYTLSLHDALPISDNLAAVRELSQGADWVYGTQGIHPHEAESYTDAVEAEIRQHAGDSKIVAIGEIGLDYYYRSEEHTSELQSRENLVCRLLLEKK